MCKKNWTVMFLTDVVIKVTILVGMIILHLIFTGKNIKMIFAGVCMKQASSVKSGKYGEYDLFAGGSLQHHKASFIK